VNDRLTIRAAVRDDFPRWKTPWDGYNAFYGRAGPTALAPEVTEMTWSRFFDAHEPMRAMVAGACGKQLYDKLADKSGFVVYRKALCMGIA